MEAEIELLNTKELLDADSDHRQKEMDERYNRNVVVRETAKNVDRIEHAIPAIKATSKQGKIFLEALVSSRDTFKKEHSFED